MEHRLKQAAAFGLGGGELGFEAVAEGHQLVDFSDDAVLFGERGDGDGQGEKVFRKKFTGAMGRSLHEAKYFWLQSLHEQG